MKVKRKIMLVIAGTLISALFILIISMKGVGAKKVWASTRIIYDAEKNLSKKVHVDITGDGKTETVKFQGKKDSYGNYSKLRVKVNGKTAFASYVGDLGMSVTYIQLSDSKSFLWISGVSDNEDAPMDRIYIYDQETNKLKRVLVLDSEWGNWKQGGFHVYSSVKTSGKNLKITYYGQTNATGYIKWSYVYVYKDGKFVLKNNAAKISSQSHQGDFVAKQTILFYKNAGSQDVTFRISSGTSVKLKKIKTYKNEYFLQFQLGNKTGWISSDQLDIFEDVMLAG